MKTGDQILNFLKGEPSFREMIGDRQLHFKTPLLEYGILDSIGIFDLINFLEKQFSFKVGSEDIVESNFRDIESVVQFIARKTNSPGQI